jgi:hypothetical protein
LVGVCDRFVAAMRAAHGRPADERAAVEAALEDYRATRRAHGIVPDDEFQTHFFLADILDDASGAQVRGVPIKELGLDKAETARISDLFLEVLGI